MGFVGMKLKKVLGIRPEANDTALAFETARDYLAAHKIKQDICYDK